MRSPPKWSRSPTASSPAATTRARCSTPRANRLPPEDKSYRTGRIKFGTESNGGFKNITITNCVFEGCRGFAIESVDGALVEDVFITNITMRHILGAPHLPAPGARMRGPPALAGVLAASPSATSHALSAEPRICSIVSGIPGHPIEDLKLSDITIQHQGGGTRADAALQLPEKERDYPEPTMFGTTPAHGFFVRHGKGLEMSGIKIDNATPDARPAFALHHVHDAEVRFIKMPSADGVPSFFLNDVTLFKVLSEETACRTSN